MNINWFAIVIINFWFFAFLGSIFTKNTNPFSIASDASILFGIGYFLYKII